MTRAQPRWSCATLGRAAIVSLYDELALEPKPGLVSFADAGSHEDMDAGTFLRSLFALRVVAGTYILSGTSPEVGNGTVPCAASTPVTIHDGEGIRVDVSCSIR